jgi:hypothetical protein
VVRLGEVGQLEIDREGFGQPVRLGDVQAFDDILGAGHQVAVFRRLTLPGVRRVFGARLAVFAGQAAQQFDAVKEFLPGLLPERLPEQLSERAHVAPQRKLLQRRVAARQLGQPRRLILRLPQ